MADGQREFKIRISGDAGELTASAKQGGEAMQEMGGQTEKFNVHGREMHKIFHQLNEVAPGLGYLFKGLFNPATLGISAVLLAVHELVKLVNEYREKVEAAKQAQSAMEVSVWESQVQGARDAAKSADEYHTALSKIAGEHDRLKDKEEKELAVLHAILAARLKILEAQERAEIAAAKGDPIQEAAIRARYGEKRTDSELKAAQDEISQKEGFLAEEKKQRAKAEADLAGAEAAKEKGPAGRDEASAARAFLDAHKEDVGKAQRGVDDAQAALDLKKKLPWPWGGEAVVSEFQGYLDEAKKKLKSAEDAREAHEATVEKYKTATDKLAEAETDALSKFKAADERVKSRQAEVDTARAVQGINVEAAGQVRKIDTAGELAAAGFKPGSALGKTLLGDIEAEEGRAHGEKMTQGQAAGIQQLVAALKAAGNNQQQINAIIKEMMDLHVDHATKLRDLLAALNQLKSQTKTGGSFNFY